MPNCKIAISVSIFMFVNLPKIDISLLLQIILSLTSHKIQKATTDNIYYYSAIFFCPFEKCKSYDSHSFFRHLFIMLIKAIYHGKSVFSSFF